MQTFRQELGSLIDNGNINASDIPEALDLTGISPNKSAWTLFLSNLLTWLGGLAISLSVIFFIAFNWDDIGRFTKFAALQILICTTIALYLFLAKTDLSKKVLLSMASLFTGALLAYFHQTYQTGADPWQLFFTWAVLILPWVIAARFAPLWFLFVVLLNITIYTYLFISGGILGILFDSELALLWTGFIFNSAVLIIWELLSNKLTYLQTRWPVRLIALAAGIAISFLCLLNIFEHNDSSALASLMWLISIVSIYIIYSKIKPDLFMVAAACLAVIIITDCFLVKHLLPNSSLDSLFILAILTIAMGSASAMWLRKLNTELKHAE